MLLAGAQKLRLTQMQLDSCEVPLDRLAAFVKLNTQPGELAQVVGQKDRCLPNYQNVVSYPAQMSGIVRSADQANQLRRLVAHDAEGFVHFGRAQSALIEIEFGTCDKEGVIPM